MLGGEFSRKLASPRHPGGKNRTDLGVQPG